MLLQLKPGLDEKDIQQIEEKAREMGLKPSLSIGKKESLVSLHDKDALEHAKELAKIEGVEGILHSDKPYKLAARKSPADRTVIDVKGLQIGGDEVIMMAGPCAIEGLEELRMSAKMVKASGAKILRASAYKPRSSPYSSKGWRRGFENTETGS